MFTEQPFYEAKVFLKAHNDALNCLKESAELKAQKDYQEYTMQRLVQGKRKAEIDIKDGQVVPALNFAQSKETKLFQFSNHIFAKYLKGFEEYTGNYKGFQHIIADGLSKLRADCN